MKRNDIILVLIILISVGVYFGITKYNESKEGVLKAEIYVNKELYKTVPLNKEKTIKIDQDGKINIVHVHDGGVEIEDANCPDDVCVKTGFVNTSSRGIVCIPHKVQVKIVGGDEEKIDIMTN
jgi:hypothetical protein